MQRRRFRLVGIDRHPSRKSRGKVTGVDALTPGKCFDIFINIKILELSWRKKAVWT